MNGMLPLMNGMLPLCATQVSYPKQYATALGNRLWKRYVTAYGNGTSYTVIQMSYTVIQMSYSVIQNVLHCYAGLAFANRLWKWLANSPTIYRTVLGTVLDM